MKKGEKTFENNKNYEKIRKNNIKRNNDILKSLGLLGGLSKKPIFNIKPPQKTPRDVEYEPEALLNPPSTPKKRKMSFEDPPATKRRRSRRLQGARPEIHVYGLEEHQEQQRKLMKTQRKTYQPPNRPRKSPNKSSHRFGAIPGIPVGTIWKTRMACCHDGVHRQTVAGISYRTEVGCYSLALSGGYPDDVDHGESFTYTGSGGRDLKGTAACPKNLRTAEQTFDQTLERGNLALVKSFETQKPIRVIRGYKLDSPFAPEEGYRYDGCYKVVKYWKATGLSGFKVYKYALTRCDDDPPPWEYEQEEESGEDDEEESDEDENDEEDEDGEEGSDEDE